MFVDESPRSAGRRSRLEIACDILSVISKGTEKPTRIMQMANVTWDDLIMYLEALIRNHLVQRSVDGKRVTYSVTADGRTLLEHYTTLRKEAASLNLDGLAKESIKAPMQIPRLGNQESELYARIERSVKAGGSKVLSAKVAGKSGAVHTLGIIAQQSDGSKHGYVILGEVDETQVVKLFVTQLDTDLSIHAYYYGELKPKVAELARAYSLDLVPWGSTGASRQG